VEAQLIDIEAYIARRIGEPWAHDDLHCWELVRQAQRDLFGRELPIVAAELALDRRAKIEAFETHPENARWRRVEKPEHGAIVKMARPGGATHRDVHAGVFLALRGGSVLHVDKPQGVACDTLFDLLTVRRWRALFFVPLI